MITLKVSNRITMFTEDREWDLNLYLIEGEHCNYIVDTGLGNEHSEYILNYLHDNGCCDKQLKIINTHYHWDHIWGNGKFKDNDIIAHKKTIELINENWDGTYLRNSDCKRGDVEKVLPNVLIDKELYFSEDQIRIFYSPGHTSDSISVLDEKDRVLIASDNIGDDDEDIVPSLFVSKSDYLDTLYKYKSLDWEIVLSGHNKVRSRDVIDDILNLL